MIDDDTPRMKDLLTLDRRAGALYNAHGLVLDPADRRWTPPDPPLLREQYEPPPGEPVSLEAAARWLQRESGAPLRVPIGVIGPREASSEQVAVARELGEGLALRGYAVICGGREGVMEAVCRGVASRGGLAIGLVPDAEPSFANPHVGIVIATGLGEARNAIIARAAFCLVAVGDSLGTLSEVALGLHFGKRVLGLAGAAAIAGVEAHGDVDAVLAAVDRLVLNLPAGRGPATGA